MLSAWPDRARWKPETVDNTGSRLLQDAWLLADNGQFASEDVSRMSVHEIERAVASPDFYPEYAFYTETDEAGEL